MSDRGLPGEARSAELDARRREGRRRLLAELEAAGQYRRYRVDPRRPFEFGAYAGSERAMLRRWYISRARWWGWLGRVGRQDLLVRLMRGMAEPEAGILRRWRAKRDGWVAAGCPAALRPWAVIEQVGRAEGGGED